MHSAVQSASVRAGNRGGVHRGRHDQDKKSKEEAPGKAEEEGEKGGCFAVPREAWGIVIDSSGNSVVAFLYRGRQCGFNTQHQRTTKDKGLKMF